MCKRETPGYKIDVQSRTVWYLTIVYAHAKSMCIRESILMSFREFKTERKMQPKILNQCVFVAIFHTSICICKTGIVPNGTH